MVALPQPELSPLDSLKRKLAPFPQAWDTPGMCATCGGEALVFRDVLSLKEYTISRMCQTCQDKIFEGLS
jgi:hypothetical protein